MQQSAALVPGDVTAWHTYTLDWQPDGVTFMVDGDTIAAAPVAPRGPLALVLWIDNQYAALPRRPAALRNPGQPGPAWLEVSDLNIGS